MFYRIEQKRQRTSLKTKPWMLHLPEATATGEKKIANQPDPLVDKRRSKRSDTNAQAATTEDPAQAAIATSEEAQQAKKKKKTADEKDRSMVRHDLKLPPPVPRPFCETDFNSIARFLDADEVRKQKDPKHKRHAPPMITTLKNFCAMTPRPEAKGFKAYVSKVKILIRRAFAKPMRLAKFGSKVKLTDLPIDVRMPSPVGKKSVLDDDIRPLFDDDDDDEGDNEDSS
ncbi:hypothetical protein R1sor_009178 [Riccia sorocarpa]|uniref:Uncharacterized protein n=1 Tax=Riccia sorocarpa TaxID=122646 RepID=A0ABD3H8Y2_9MARC